MPGYLAKLYELHPPDRDMWKEFTNGIFAVKKTDIEFTSIGVDHALEQENRKMKVLGGLTGITRKPTTLTHFFLVALELARLSTEAENMAGITKAKRSHHPQTSATAIRRQENNIHLLRAVMEVSNPFKIETGDLMNFITKSIMPGEVACDILRRQSVGEEAYREFVSARITGDVNLWDRMTKIKLKTWTDAGKVVRMNVDNKALEIKENRSLFARMVIAARTRPDIDIHEAVGKYEFSNVSRALFASDGNELACQNKSSLMGLLEKLPVESAAQADGVGGIRRDSNEMVDILATGTMDTTDDFPEPKKVLIMDGMAVLHETPFQHGNNATCSDLACAFLSVLGNRVQCYDVAHVIFDHYNTGVTIKQQTRDRRAANQPSDRQYMCTDSTPIKTRLNQFMQSRKTKHSLTIYLAQKTLDHFSGKDKVIVVSTQLGTQSHQDDVAHLSTDQEEADTVIFLHALDAARNGSIIHIMSPDTDVFVLALYHLRQLGMETRFITGTCNKRRTIRLEPIYEALGNRFIAALPGFHSFTGCDTVGQFSGKGKVSCWNTLQKVEEYVIEAFIQLGMSVLPSSETIKSLEAYVCQLYAPELRSLTLAS